MKRALLWVVATIIAMTAFAIPSQRLPFTVKQSDGTSLTLMLIGDETCHYLTTTDGAIVIEKDGTYFYAAIENNTLVSSGIMVHEPELRSIAEQTFVTENKGIIKEQTSAIWKSRLNKRNEARSKRRLASDTSNTLRLSQNSFTGKKRGLVILTNFSNLAMKTTNTPQAFNEQFNKKGYNKNHHNGSVRDYFLDQSYGALDIEFDIVGPVTVSHPYTYYGKNNSDGEDMHVCELAAEVCKLAEKEGVDFSPYDWNGDGEIEQVYIIHAGYGEHYRAPESTIWAHEYTLDEGKELNDGEGSFLLKSGHRINTYAMSCELYGTTGSQMDAIGTACHEFTHCLGLPDFYDTEINEDDGIEGVGMSCWDLLDSGSHCGWGNNGSCPTGYTAYERWFAGWLTPIELNTPCNVIDMPDIGKKPVAYIIYNDANHNEYFLLENRQGTGWFKYARAFTDIHGMLVTHVDYDKKAWNDNTVNADPNHQRMSFVAADNSYSTSFSNKSYYAGDLFPGSNNVCELTNTSHKNCGGKLYNRNTDKSYDLNKPITDIKEANGLISFKFMGGGDSISSTEDISVDGDSNITYYNLNGTRIVGTPTIAGIYIMHSNKETKKIIIR